MKDVISRDVLVCVESKKFRPQIYTIGRFCVDIAFYMKPILKGLRV